MADNPFLKKISLIESSGGKDTDHKVMESGIHKGQSAIGKYGLMPNTINEIIKRYKPELKELLNYTPQQLKEYIETNPEIEDSLALSLQKHVEDNTKGDPEKMAYAWNMGHNLKSESITDEKLNKSPYVNKFRKLASLDSFKKVEPLTYMEQRKKQSIESPIPFSNEENLEEEALKENILYDETLRQPAEEYFPELKKKLKRK